MANDKEAKRRGRPPKYPMPDKIPDTPENVARAVLNTPPQEERRLGVHAPPEKWEGVLLMV